MKSIKSLFSKTVSLFTLGLCCTLFTTVPSNAFLDDKFKQEVETEKVAVKLVRDVQKAGYNLVTTEELKSWIDSKKDMVIVDTMPYGDSYKKGHIPGAVQILFPIPDMPTWNLKETDGKTEEDFKKLLGNDLN
ncbi:MAG: rhodanese-like domain-containing protein, partial [Desulfamplus sp.]|nr:rhodanese-like domain-containing protein [Desulfamplus sp.]